VAIQIRPVLLSKGGHPSKACSVIEIWTSKYGLLYYQTVAIEIRPVLLKKLAIQIGPVRLSTDGHPNTACNNGFLKTILHQTFYNAMIRRYL
jgi:hypothetical protein